MTTTRPSIIPLDQSIVSAAKSPSLLAQLGRKLLLGQLSKLQNGSLRIVEPGGDHRFGKRTAECDLAATVHVENPQFFADVTFGGTVGAGEAYIRGLWKCDDLT